MANAEQDGTCGLRCDSSPARCPEEPRSEGPPCSPVVLHTPPRADSPELHSGLEEPGLTGVLEYSGSHPRTLHTPPRVDSLALDSGLEQPGLTGALDCSAVMFVDRNGVVFSKPHLDVPWDSPSMADHSNAAASSAPVSECAEDRPEDESDDRAEDASSAPVSECADDRPEDASDDRPEDASSAPVSECAEDRPEDAPPAPVSECAEDGPEDASDDRPEDASPAPFADDPDPGADCRTDAQLTAEHLRLACRPAASPSCVPSPQLSPRTPACRSVDLLVAAAGGALASPTTIDAADDDPERPLASQYAAAGLPATDRSLATAFPASPPDERAPWCRTHRRAGSSGVDVDGSGAWAPEACACAESMASLPTPPNLPSVGHSSTAHKALDCDLNPAAFPVQQGLPTADCPSPFTPLAVACSSAAAAEPSSCPSHAMSEAALAPDVTPLPVRACSPQPRCSSDPHTSSTGSWDGSTRCSPDSNSGETSLPGGQCAEPSEYAPSPAAATPADAVRPRTLDSWPLLLLEGPGGRAGRCPPQARGPDGGLDALDPCPSVAPSPPCEPQLCTTDGDCDGAEDAGDGEADVDTDTFGCSQDASLVAGTGSASRSSECTRGHMSKPVLASCAACVTPPRPEGASASQSPAQSSASCATPGVLAVPGGPVGADADAAHPPQPAAALLSRPSMPPQPTLPDAPSTDTLDNACSHSEGTPAFPRPVPLVRQPLSAAHLPPPKSHDRPAALFDSLDSHLLDKIIRRALPSARLGLVCRSFHESVRRVATRAVPWAGPIPVDPNTTSLNLASLSAYPELLSLQLPKLEGAHELLAVDLFRLRSLTRLTQLEILCASSVLSFQPLRLLPRLARLAAVGVSLSPPPDLPPLPGCDVMLYVNHGMNNYQQSTLTALPQLSGLRTASNTPASLIRQISTCASTSRLTYLRLGGTNMPALGPLSGLTTLQRLHLHVRNATLQALSTLTRLTYLHLHGSSSDLATMLVRLTALQKLSLFKCKRLRTDDIRAVGRLTGLTTLELPCSKSAWELRDVRPLSRLSRLQHLCLSMPREGISPLADLPTLTYLRLKYRARSYPGTHSSSLVFASLASSAMLSCHFMASASGSSAGGASARACSRTAVRQGLLTSATAITSAAAAPVLVWGVRKLWHACTAPVTRDTLISDLGKMTQLQWLEVKGSTQPTAADWVAVLRPLNRLRRLDVRKTKFRDLSVLRGLPHLQVLHVMPMGLMLERPAAIRRAARLAPEVDVHM